MSIEVKIIDKNVKKEISLVELNLNKNEKGERVVGIFSKKKQNKNLKTLSDKEVYQIKEEIKRKKKNKKTVKKITKNDENKKKRVKFKN